MSAIKIIDNLNINTELILLGIIYDVAAKKKCLGLYIIYRSLNTRNNLTFTNNESKLASIRIKKNYLNVTSQLFILFKC